MKKFRNLKIGIIGCGYWATNIIKTLEEQKIRNIYVQDINKTQLKNIVKKFSYLKIYNKIDDIIDLNLDCYFLVTPTNSHYRLAKKLISNKKNVLVEKPVSASSSKIKILNKLSKKNKTIFMSGYIYNYNVYIEYIKKTIQSKNFGNIKYIYIERSNLGPIRNDVSCIWDLASHDISTCIYLLGENLKPKSLNTYDFLKKKIHDISTIYLSHKNTQIEIKSNWLNPEKIRKMIIIGKNKMLQFDEMNQYSKIKIYDKYAKYPNINNFKKNFFTPKAFIHSGKTFAPKIKFESPLKNEIFHFLNCVINKKLPKTDGTYALKVSQIIEKIEKKIN